MNGSGTPDQPFLIERHKNTMPRKSPRRAFVKTIVAAGVAGSSADLGAQQAGRVSGFDHVALPMQNTDAMVAFYRGLGFQMSETVNAVSVYIGTQMINFHRPARWQDSAFTLRAAAAGRHAAICALCGMGPQPLSRRCWIAPAQRSK